MAASKGKPLQSKLDYKVAALKLRRKGLSWSQIAEHLDSTEEELRELADVERPEVMTEIIAQLKRLYATKPTRISNAQLEVLQQALTREVRRQGSYEFIQSRVIHELAKLYPDRMREAVERLKLRRPKGD